MQKRRAEIPACTLLERLSGSDRWLVLSATLYVTEPVQSRDIIAALITALLQNGLILPVSRDVRRALATAGYSAEADYFRLTAPWTGATLKL